MFFMAKSALCIGIVTVLAAGAAGGGDVRAALEGGGREVAARLGRACAASEDCVATGARIAAAGVGQPGAISDVLARAGIARMSDALAVPRAVISSASMSDGGGRPHRAERSIRRAVAAQD